MPTQEKKQIFRQTGSLKTSSFSSITTQTGGRNGPKTMNSHALPWYKSCTINSYVRLEFNIDFIH